MRADRLVSILLWLQVHGKTSTTDLARRLEVSPRTILRDMDALSVSGVPVIAHRGRSGGWSLPEQYRTSSRWLSANEVRALAVLTPAHVLADLGIADMADAAWLKLIAALPPGHRDEATFAQDRIHIDTSTWRPRREPTAWLAELKDAVFSDRLVHIHYRRSNGDRVSRTVAPLGLVAKGHAWYLAGQVENQIRTYRVSRIQLLNVQTERFVRPADFDLRAFWEASKVSLEQGLPRYPATLRIEARAAKTLPRGLRWARLERIDPAEPDGWCRASILFETLDDARTSVLSFGDRVEVLGPRELRDAIVDSARSTLSLYTQSSQGSNASSDDPANDKAGLIGEHASHESKHPHSVLSVSETVSDAS